MKAYTENEVIESLFHKGGTLANEGIEIRKHRKNSKEVYFKYKGREFCFNKHNVILKFSDTPGGRYFQFACLERDIFATNQEEQAVVDALKEKLGR